MVCGYHMYRDRNLVSYIAICETVVRLGAIIGAVMFQRCRKMLMVGGGGKRYSCAHSVCENFWITPTFRLNYTHFCVKQG